jgi:hypothetical protein
MAETTRRYPRTLAEAFKGPEYASAIERHAPTGYPLAWWALVALCGLAAMVLSWVTR